MLLRECLINVYAGFITNFIVHGKNIHFVSTGEEESDEFKQIRVNDNKKSFKQIEKKDCTIPYEAALTSCKAKFIFVTGVPTGGNTRGPVR